MVKIKIVDLKCTVIEGYPLIRVDTDEEISGLAQIESPKYYIKPHVLFYKRYILEQDPTLTLNVLCSESAI